MRPSRNYLEDLLTQFALDTIDAAGAARFGSPVYADEMTGKKQETRRSILTAWDEQEATIRELSEALEAVLDNVPACVFVDTYPWEGRCGIHDFTIQKPRECAVQHAVEVLARARGAS